MIQHLNHSEQESSTQLAIYDSDKPVTLKQDQGDQTWYDLVDPNKVISLLTGLKAPTN